MKEHFAGEEVGYSDAISGVIYGQHFHIHGMKDPDYTTMLMTTYCAWERNGSGRKQHVTGQGDGVVQISRDCLGPLHLPTYC